MKILRALLFPLLSSVLVACGSDSDSDSDPSGLVGYLMPDGVEGIDYQTTTYEGLTGPGGSFRYEEGDLITFRVGDIVFADAIPAKQFMTFVDFDPAAVAILEAGEVENGLTGNSELESEQVRTDRIDNISRFLFSIDDDNERENGIQVSSSVRQELIDSELSPLIDFDIPAEEFRQEDEETTDDVDETSLPRQLINSLCFPEDQDCDDEFGRVMIGGLTPIEYLEDTYFLIAARIFINPEQYEIAAEDTRIFRARLDLRGLHGEVREMEVVTSDEIAQLVQTPPPAQRQVVGIDSFDVNGGSVDFFSVGNSGESTEIVINLRLDNDYRWIRKTFRVSLL